MSSEKLLDAIGELSEGRLADAETTARRCLRAKKRRTWGLAAACLCLGAAVSLWALGGFALYKLIIKR